MLMENWIRAIFYNIDDILFTIVQINHTSFITYEIEKNRMPGKIFNQTTDKMKYKWTVTILDFIKWTICGKQMLNLYFSLFYSPVKWYDTEESSLVSSNKALTFFYKQNVRKCTVSNQSS
jgi:hypothetical protein